MPDPSDSDSAPDREADREPGADVDPSSEPDPDPDPDPDSDPHSRSDPRPDAAFVDLVKRSATAETRREFERRVAAQADALREALADGRFENDAYSVGLELEAYAVDPDGARLARVPEVVFETPACNGELGLHNVELNTDAAPLDDGGLSAQADAIAERVASAREAFESAGVELVLDGMWTVPPAEGTRAYLSATDDVDGVTVARNMRASPRYCAIDNDVLARAGGSVTLDVPGFRGSFPSILVESLTSSIQPHLQVPDSAAFPAHYRVAIRTMGPVLALATNSPFLPADLYAEGGRGDGDGDGDGAGDAGTGRPDGEPLADRDPYALVDRTPHELRVPVFEASVDAGVAGDDRKVRVPRDVERATDVVDRLVADRTCAPFLKEWVTDADAAERYADRVWELDHKRGTYWRWLRAVVGGQALAGVSERSLRIEYRPVPTQPTVADVVALQWLVVGLVRGLVAADHPVRELPWEAARESFYAAVDDGLDADLAWVDADGERTSDPERIYPELFEYARRGLREHGLDAGVVDERLAPVERRWRERTTPSRWRKAAVRDRLDRGVELPAAVEAVGREYVERAASGEPFVEWD
jgi:hypothetical protein